nr:restriction endonuclease subunit S [uncultured Romboutsia sp.]
MKDIEWGEYKIDDLFEKLEVNKLKYKTSELPDKPNKEYILPALTSGIQNQGLNNYVPLENATILKNVITISANGANTGATFYQKSEFTVLQDAYAINIKKDLEYSLTDNQYIFLVSSISKSIYGNFEWTNKAGWEKVKNKYIQLPIKEGKIDFEFMESFVAELEAQHVAELEAQHVAELEAYLLATGLEDYELTDKEKQAIDEFNNIVWNSYNLKELFGESTRGKRLKSADRIEGDLPFVTAGETNEGISAFIGNDVYKFSKNTTTIDMFGSAKYRNYDYGCDDHISVVHTEKLAMKAAIFVTASIHKSSHNGQFNYGKNFYPKDADKLNIMLPQKYNEPDYDYMENLISAVQKLVIKDVVLYADEKIRLSKDIIYD